MRGPVSAKRRFTWNGAVGFTRESSAIRRSAGINGESAGTTKPVPPAAGVGAKFTVDSDLA